ncbi:MAG: YicC family protein [Bacteroidia bacterium]|nr:YicC family protein [Bacteroidia bacterium]
MILSMTGFGKATEDFADKTVSVEIKSLNSKQLDLNLRLSSFFREKEMELRTEIQHLLDRGKVDLSIQVDYKTDEPSAVINSAMAENYFKQIDALAKKMNSKTDVMGHVLRLPDVFKQEKKELTDEEWKQVWATCQKAIAKLITFRQTEGKTLEQEFTKRINLIAGCLTEVEKSDAARLENVRNRIKNNLDELIPQDKIDKNRFEQELIFYMEKLDITEEKVRLKTHLDYFLNTMKEPGCGRKLNFISQEIGREINTIGSKANDATVQKIVVQMKDELEKIKEQSMNVL